MEPPLIKTIIVPCAPELAFDTFLGGMARWWPLDKFTLSAMKGAPASDIRIDLREGGEITEIGADGTETPWGHIERLDRPGYLSMRFHIPAPGYEVTGRTRVEVRFEAVDDGTLLTLTQSDWEALAQGADMVRGGYDKGWEMLLGAYAGVCAS